MLEENQLTPSEAPAGLDCQARVGEVATENVMALEYAAVPNEPAATAVLFGTGVVPSTVEAAECACSNSGGNSNGRSKSLVYVLGQIGYDFGTESRRDSFLQQSGRNVQDTSQMLEYLRESPAAAASMIWTLSLDTTVIYAVAPLGPYANVAYDRLGEFLQAQMNEGVERVSVPGIIAGSVTLLNGQQVPAIIPDVRGMYSWSTSELIKAVAGDEPQPAEMEGIQNFLERVYYEVRNLGSTPQERAMNYAATNAFQLKTVYSDAIKADLKLDNIGFERSPICRPGSDCWDVKLVFFNPAKRLEQARRVYRFTVDVSDVIPVTVGKVRHWDIY